MVLPIVRVGLSTSINLIKTVSQADLIKIILKAFLESCLLEDFYQLLIISINHYSIKYLLVID